MNIKHIEEKLEIVDQVTREIRDLITKQKLGVTPGKWWLISTRFEYLVYVTKVKGGVIEGHGFTCDEHRTYATDAAFMPLDAIQSARPATELEVIELLEKEAEKRGLVAGVKVKDLFTKNIRTILNRSHSCPVRTTEPDFWVTSTTDRGIKILDNGVWAEPVKDQWKMRSPFNYGDDCRVVSNDGDGYITVRSGRFLKQRTQCIIDALNKEGL